MTEREQIAHGYNTRSAGVSDFRSLVALLTEAEYYHNMGLRSKRRAVYITITERCKGRVWYLYDDGVNQGNCLITNLHRYFRFW